MAQYDPQKHHRRSIRLKGYDYTQPGAYFVTLVAWGRECLFGELEGGEMHRNDYGLLVENEWRRLEKRFNRVIADEFITMPNHVHAILFLVDPDSAEADHDPSNTVGAGQEDSVVPGVGAGQEGSIQSGESSFAPPLRDDPHIAAHLQTLGEIIRAYKSTTARLINGLRRTPGIPVWQRNYYEHVIRNEEDLKRIRAYIHDNPRQWERDRENPLKSG